jgi:hypothetical protein
MTTAREKQEILYKYQHNSFIFEDERQLFMIPSSITVTNFETYQEKIIRRKIKQKTVSSNANNLKEQ